MGSVSGRVRGHGIPLLPRVRLWTWTEQRMARRYRTRSRAQIVVLGHEAIGCSVADISATGARVLVDPAASVPDSFILKLRGRAQMERGSEPIPQGDISREAGPPPRGNQCEFKGGPQDDEQAEHGAPPLAK
jgi:hypothetical protein